RDVHAEAQGDASVERVERQRRRHGVPRMAQHDADRRLLDGWERHGADVHQFGVDVEGDVLLLRDRGRRGRERLRAVEHGQCRREVSRQVRATSAASYERLGESHFSVSSTLTPLRFAYDSTWSRPMRPTLKYFASGCEK